MGRNAKLIIAGILSLALLLACAALPELIHSRSSAGGPGSAGEPGPSETPGLAGAPNHMTLARRAAYFARFFANDKTLKVQRAYDAKALPAADEAVSAVKDLFQIDSGATSAVIDEGIKYFTLDCGEDGVIRLMEYSREWNALWHNWFDITVDMDTGDIYYFYASSGVLKTLESFQNVNGVPETADELLTAFTAITGLQTAGPYEKTGQVTYTQAFSDGESTVTYNIIFNYAPPRLLDVKMTIQGETRTPSPDA